MKLLLDTHIWLWSLLEPDRLAPQVRQALGDPANELWLSPISAWETVLLAERGRISIGAGGSPSEWVQRALAAAPVRDAPLTRAVALRSRDVQLEHQDPADRFLAATARVYDLVLVTADALLLAGRGFQTLANR